MHKPDSIKATNSDAKFTPHEAGQFVGQAVDVIALGEVVMDFPLKPKYLAQKCAIVFRTGEKNPDSGEFIDISREFTVSMGEKSNLRPFLESWRGKKYTPEEVDAGVPLDKLCGQWALLTIEQRSSNKSGRKYGYILGATGVPKQMRGGLTAYTDYERAEYWAKKKEEYAVAARAFRAEIGAPNGVTEDDGEPQDTTDYSDEQAAQDAEDSSLPF